MECGGRRVLNLHSAIHLRRFSPTFSTAITTTLPTRRRPCSWLLSVKSRRPNSPMLSLCSPPPPSTFCSSYSQNTVVMGIGGDEAFGGESSEKRGQGLLNVVLVSPQIAGNTGCIARTCAASSVSLHLVEPLGYKVDDTKLKRAGLDYWPYVVVKIHSSWEEFVDFFRKQDDKKRLLAFTKKGAKIHSEFSYRPGDWLVFGSETSGLPPEALHDCNSEELGGGTLRIPMVETYVRCLNLSVSVGIALYEASRQLNYEQMQCPPNAINADDGRLFTSEDIYT